MEMHKEKIRFFLQFFFDTCENASHGSEIPNGAYGADTVTANYVQFWFRQFRSDLYCQQLDRLKLAIDQKWPESANRRGAVFHQDNARPHTSVVTGHSLWELGWKVLMHPPNSMDLAPSDYNLFLALKNFLRDKKLGSTEDCENQLLDVFANKSQDFYERDIMKPHIFKMTTNYTTKRCIFDPNQTIGSMLNKVLISLQK
ncbi:histone-lysine N-methyltransferase SETMAR [Trichonephila clavipes]|nr:histone-lysine N-methyltransferase SETMAR [Trichonephila clavipes]